MLIDEPDLARGAGGYRQVDAGEGEGPAGAESVPEGLWHAQPMECLWLAGELPFPPKSGCLVYSRGLAESLARAGLRVTALGLDREHPGTQRSDQLVRWRPVEGRRRRAPASLLSPLPRMAHSFATRSYRRASLRALCERQWDVVVVDHLQMGWVIGLLERRSPPPLVVYASQNHERSVRRAVGRHGGRGLRGVALAHDARKASRLEAAVLERADLVSCVTEHDIALFRADRPDLRYVLATPGYDAPRIAERHIDRDTPRRVVIVSSLDWHVKQANLRALLEVADPAFAAAGVELCVLGPAPERFVGSLRAKLRATTFSGWVPSLGEPLAGARMGIVSEPLGGGFKLKSLDYVFNRVPLAAIDGSAVGLPLRSGVDFLSYPDERSLVEGVLAVIDDTERLDRMQHEAFAACVGRFDWSTSGRELAEAIAATARLRSVP